MSTGARIPGASTPSLRNRVLAFSSSSRKLTARAPPTWSCTRVGSSTSRACTPRHVSGECGSTRELPMAPMMAMGSGRKPQSSATCRGQHTIDAQKKIKTMQLSVQASRPPNHKQGVGEKYPPTFSPSSLGTLVVARLAFLRSSSASDSVSTSTGVHVPRRWRGTTARSRVVTKQ